MPAEDSAWVFSTGQIVSGRYRIVRFLGRGGMGEVYEGEDLELHEQVALKTLLPGIAADASMIARFKREIQLSRKISHPNVCRVFDLARDPADESSEAAITFLTMEFLAGETLEATLGREGRLSADGAVPLLDQMAEALGAAHRAGIIHRDFKPSNVMLVPNVDGLRAVVTDFGLAHRVAPTGDTTATLTGKVMGTLDYMAPELLTGDAASVESDVYALGMVAYRILTGTLPFPNDTPLAGAILRAKVPVPSPRSLTPELDPACETYVLAKEVRTLGLHEDFYRRAQEDPGIFITKGEVAAVEPTPANLLVRMATSQLGDNVELEVDLVVLATGMVPVAANGEAIRELRDARKGLARGDGNTEVLQSTIDRLASHEGTDILGLTYRQGPDLPSLEYGFPDSHFICFPYETRRSGSYAAGCVRTYRSPVPLTGSSR